MKKVLTVVLAMLICISLCGCKQKTNEEIWQEQLNNVDQEKVKKLGEGLIDYHLGGY